MWCATFFHSLPYVARPCRNAACSASVQRPDEDEALGFLPFRLPLLLEEDIPANVDRARAAEWDGGVRLAIDMAFLCVGAVVVVSRCADTGTVLDKDTIACCLVR